MKMRGGYVSAAIMTVLLGLSVYAILNIYNRVTSWWSEIHKDKDHM